MSNLSNMKTHVLNSSTVANFDLVNITTHLSNASTIGNLTAGLVVLPQGRVQLQCASVEHEEVQARAHRGEERPSHDGFEGGGHFSGAICRSSFALFYL